ncbi:MAG: hypothetical protein C0582_04055 [Alphaproteobacteria bacterium]|nr:MAG: hypothetical protein C0582_04055 [Alphaproteobacteria bacterium]
MTNQQNTQAEGYRKKNTFLAKIVITLILVAFMFTGVQSYLASGQKSQTVAEVGSTKIRQNQIEHTIKRVLTDLPGSVDPAILFSTKMIKKIVQDEIDARLMDAEVEKLNLTVPEVVLKSYLRSIPDFQPQQIKQYLQRTGQNEKNFLGQIAQDLMKNQLLVALFSGISLPKNLLDVLSKAQLTERSVRILTVTEKALPSLKTPSNKVLKEFYEKNETHFEVPEKRDFKMLMITHPKTDVSKEEIATYYQNNKERFSQPELREIAVLSISKDQPTTSTEDLKKNSASFIPLGSVSRSMIDETLAEKVFSLGENQFSEGIIDQGKQKIYWVKKITPSRTLDLNQIKDQIEKTLKQEKTIKEQKALVQKIDDAIAAGDSFEEIEKKYPKTVTIKTFKNKSFNQLHKEFGSDQATQIFRQQMGEEGQIYYDQNQKAYAFGLEKVQAKHVPKFEKIQEVVKRHYLQREAIKRAQDKGLEIVQSLNNGSKINERHLRKEVINKNNLLALNSKLNLTIEQLIQLSKLKENQAMLVKTDEGAKVIVVTHLQKNETPLKQKKEFEEAINNIFRQNYRGAYLKALEKKYGVKVYSKVIDNIHSQLSSKID